MPIASWPLCAPTACNKTWGLLPEGHRHAHYLFRDLRSGMSPKRGFSVAMLQCSNASGGRFVSGICKRDRQKGVSLIYSWEFPNLVVSNLVVCSFYAEALFCTLLLPFALLRLRSFVFICRFLRTTVFRTTAFGNSRCFDWTNRKKTKQTGTNRCIPKNKEGRKRRNQNKMEQIGVTPFCRPQIGGSDCTSTMRTFGAWCFQNGQFRRISSTLHFAGLQSIGGYASARRMSAQAVLPPVALFHAETFALPPCAPKSHLCLFPHLGSSDLSEPQCSTPCDLRFFFH